jgi:hypothetical protein
MVGVIDLSWSGAGRCHRYAQHGPSSENARNGDCQRRDFSLLELKLFGRSLVLST